MKPTTLHKATGALLGLAAAFYGVDDIPREWRQKISMREYIEELARGLSQ